MDTIFNYAESNSEKDFLDWISSITQSVRKSLCLYVGLYVTISGYFDLYISDSSYPIVCTLHRFFTQINLIDYSSNTTQVLTSILRGSNHNAIFVVLCTER